MLRTLLLLALVCLSHQSWISRGRINLGNKTCYSPTASQAKGIKLDISILFDTSSLLTPNGFKSAAQMVSGSLLPSLTVGGGGSRVALLDFGSFVDIRGDYSTCENLGDCQAVIGAISYVSFSTASDLATALDTVTMLQGSGSGNRPEVPDFVLIITATNPLSMSAALHSASQLKATGATIFTLGIGYDVDWIALKQLASVGSQNALLQPVPIPQDQLSAVSAAILASMYCAQNPVQPAPRPGLTTPGAPVTTTSPRKMPGWMSPINAQIGELIDWLVAGNGAGKAYDWLSAIVDNFGPRVVTSPALNATIAYLLQDLKHQGFDNVHAEPVRGIDSWVRGEEWCVLNTPRHHKMRILGIGRSAPTPGGAPLTAPVAVVRSFDELHAMGAAGTIKGKIVVFNQNWTTYPGGWVFRNNGALEAAKYGAVGVLVRSVTPFSIYSPHTGAGAAASIPMACITVEDAEMLWRFQTRRVPMSLTLKMTGTSNGPTTVAQDTVFQITGWTLPEEIVMLSGHLDSWDVGTGAMDDGGGCAVAWGALYAMRNLGMKPKRTIRVVFWGSEERGPQGVYYHDVHKSWTNETFRFVSESDEGAFRPANRSSALLYFWGKDTYWQGVKTQTLINLAGDTAAKKGVLFGLQSANGPNGGDVSPWERDGVPGAAYVNRDRYDYYFNFHHTEGDTMTIFRPDDLDYTAAMFASVAWTLANA